MKKKLFVILVLALLAIMILYLYNYKEQQNMMYQNVNIKARYWEVYGNYKDYILEIKNYNSFPVEVTLECTWYCKSHTGATGTYNEVIFLEPYGFKKHTVTTLPSEEDAWYNCEIISIQKL